ncbi:MAG: MATE family efflux transporter [Candidatus Goldiibacteriota bacterium]
MEHVNKNNMLRIIIALSWPMLLANNVLNGAAMFDLFLIGKLGVSELAAFSICGIILSVYLTMQGGMMSGAIAVVSRFLGGKRHSELSSGVVQIMLFAFAIALIFSSVLFVFLEEVLVFFGAKGQTLESSMEYLPVMLVSLVMMSIFFMFVSIVRAAGDSITPLKFMSLAAVINIILDPLLIFGIGPFPEMSLKGAAIANLTGFIIVDIIALHLLFSGKTGIKIEPRHIKFDPSMMIRFIRIVIPAMAQGFIDRGSYMILLKIISAYGDPFIASFGIINNLTMFLKRFGWPIGNSGGVIVGHSLGRGSKDNVKLAVKTSFILYTYITAFFSIVCFLFAGPIIKIFTSDSSVIAYGTDFLRIFAPAYILIGVGVIVFTAFNSAGATGLPNIINLITFYVIQIPLALTLPQYMGESGIFWAVSIGAASHGAVSFLFMKFTPWMDKRI